MAKSEEFTATIWTNGKHQKFIKVHHNWCDRTMEIIVRSIVRTSLVCPTCGSRIRFGA